VLCRGIISPAVPALVYTRAWCSRRSVREHPREGVAGAGIADISGAGKYMCTDCRPHSMHGFLRIQTIATNQSTLLYVHRRFGAISTSTYHCLIAIRKLCIIIQVVVHGTLRRLEWCRSSASRMWLKASSSESVLLWGSQWGHLSWW